MLVTNSVRSSGGTSTNQSSAQGAPNTSDLVGLFVDWENFHYANYGLVKQTDPEARFHATLPDVDKILTIASRFGRIAVGAAYADWSRSDLRRAANTLFRHGVDPVFVPGSDYATGVPVKNAADIGLAVAMIDTFHRFPSLGTFIIASGDGGLLSVATFLRRQGKQVVVLSVSCALSEHLADAADIVIRYDDETPCASHAPRPIAASRALTFATFVGWVKDIVLEAEDHCPLNHIGQQLKLRHGVNAREHYGCSLKELLLRAAPAFSFDESTGVAFVSLAPASSIDTDGLIPAA